MPMIMKVVHKIRRVNLFNVNTQQLTDEPQGMFERSFSSHTFECRLSRAAQSEEEEEKIVSTIKTETTRRVSFFAYIY